MTLTLGRGIHPPTPFRFAINQLTDVPGAGVGVSNLAGNLLSGADNGVPGGAYVVILRGNAGGIVVPSTREAAVTRPVPQSVAAIDAVLEADDVGGTWVAARLVAAAVVAPSTVVVDSRSDRRAPVRPLVDQLCLGNSGMSA